TMEVEELIQSFDSFAQKVQEVSLADLAKMGLTVVSFTLKELRDNVGYLEALGRKRTAEAKREADIGVANASKETTIAQAAASRDSTIAQ
ncbi:MAG TPA: flotillin family protein, partial [Candidatus Obscuribacterales bacterium]|nr:flotillin family protein [Candidatus Obscuribacterales bacterium]